MSVKNGGNSLKKLFKAFCSFVIISSLIFSYAPSINAKNINLTKNTSKTYTFKNGKTTIYYKYSHKDEFGHYWNIKEKHGAKITKKYQLVEGQRSNLYYEGYPNSDVGFFLPLPIKVNKKWNNGQGGSKDIWIVKSKNKLVKTKAGTFKNAIHIYSSTHKTSYYLAPRSGIIKVVTKGKTTFELISRR